MTLFVVDAGHRDRHEAEHFALDLAPEATQLCTHVVREPSPHHAEQQILTGDGEQQ